MAIWRERLIAILSGVLALTCAGTGPAVYAAERGSSLEAETGYSVDALGLRDAPIGHSQVAGSDHLASCDRTAAQADAASRTFKPVMALASAPAGGSAFPCPAGRSAITVPDASPQAEEAFGLKATLYITTARGSGRDSVGCDVVPMRTVAVDGKIVTRHTILFIRETVGLPMPDGSLHDGYWYATDVGANIHAGRIDLYTGKGRHTIAPLLHLNLKTLTVKRAGRFAGCPSRDGTAVAAQTAATPQAPDATSVNG